MNTYLEKIAANAYKAHLASKGVNVSGISNASLLAAGVPSKPKGTFSNMDNAANRIGKKSIPGFKPMPKPSISSRINSAAGIGPVMKTTGNAISEGALSRRATMAAQGTTLKDALHAHVSAKQAAGTAAQSGARGLLGKAVGLAKKHPLAAAAVGGVAAAGAAGAALKGFSRREPEATVYQGY